MISMERILRTSPAKEIEERGRHLAAVREDMDAIACVPEDMRDMILDQLWDEAKKIPVSADADGEVVLDGGFLDFPAGTPRSDVHAWFDRWHSQGVGSLVEFDAMSEDLQAPSGTM